MIISSTYVSMLLLLNVLSVLTSGFHVLSIPTMTIHNFFFCCFYWPTKKKTLKLCKSIENDVLKWCASHSSIKTKLQKITNCERDDDDREWMNQWKRNEMKWDSLKRKNDLIHFIYRTKTINNTTEWVKHEEEEKWMKKIKVINDYHNS